MGQGQAGLIVTIAYNLHFTIAYAVCAALVMDMYQTCVIIIRYVIV